MIEHSGTMEILENTIVPKGYRFLLSLNQDGHKQSWPYKITLEPIEDGFEVYAVTSSKSNFEQTCRDLIKRLETLQLNAQLATGPIELMQTASFSALLRGF